MEKEKDIMTAVKIREKNGISFFHIHSEKFKTISLNVIFATGLDKKRATINALIPHILKRGCKNYPGQMELAIRLEELYGADMSVSVGKKGETQLIRFRTGFVSDRFTADRTRLFEEASDLLLEVITKPMLDNGSFKKEYFDQERENLIQRIRSRVNNKMSYAISRCMEEMCKGEPFEVYEDGDEETAKALTVADLMETYNDILEKYPAFVYISGDVSEKELNGFADKFDSINRHNIKPLEKPQVDKKRNEPLRIEEPMDVSQGKLCVGLRTQIGADSPDYFPLAIYNGILGGGVHSKLFRNVREKESLAYSAFSMLEKYKGLLVACCGIDIANREKAEGIILDQIEAIKKGDISDAEMESTRKSFETGLNIMQDSQEGMVDFYLSRHLAGIDENINEFYENLMSVGKEDVIRISEKITPDTIYFLTSLHAGNAERSGDTDENNRV
ncbi:MAG: insulinase family protein [Clostridiaceae bacterium]|nr:insulinase family protein [Clostridiaceae bacterium]